LVDVGGVVASRVGLVVHESAQGVDRRGADLGGTSTSHWGGDQALLFVRPVPCSGLKV